MDDSHTPDFPTTQWSVVVRAKSWTNEGRQACGALCEQYYYPVYSYFRKLGLHQDEAESHTHNFFAGFLEGGRPWSNLMRNADPKRGISFRSCLIMSLKSYLYEFRRSASAIKRGGGTNIVSFDAMTAEQRYMCEPSHIDDPESQLTAAWAKEVVEQGLRRLKQLYGPERFDALKCYLVSTGEAVSYAETAKKLGMSENGISKTVSRFRAAYHTALRSVVGETVQDPSEVDEEWNELFKALKAGTSS